MIFKKLFLLLPVIIFSDILMAADVIPPGKEQYFLDIVKPYNKEISGYSLKNVFIRNESVRYEYCKDVCFYVVLKRKSAGGEPLSSSKNFNIYVEGNVYNVDINPLVNSIRINETGDVFSTVDNTTPSLNLGLKNLNIGYILIMVILLTYILLSIKQVSDITSRWIDKISNISDRVYFILFLVVIGYAAYLRYRNIYLPLVEGGSAIRVLFAYDSIIYNLFISDDPRHPGLYFLLLKPFILIFGQPEYSARIFSATLSLISVAVMGLIVKEKSRFNSIFAMLLLAIHPEYIYRSREITDISLFVLMSLLAILALKKAESSERSIYKIIFAIFLALSCLSSYAAYVNLAAILFYLILKGRIREYIRYLIVTLLLIFPYILKIVFSLKEEFYSRHMANKFPDLIWGGNSLPDFIVRSLYVLFAGEYTFLILVLVVVFLIMTFERLKKDSFFLILFVVNFSFIFLSKFFRMMPYYLIFLPVSFIMMVTYLDIVNDTVFKKMYVLLVFISTLISFIINLNDRFETTYVQGYHLRTNPELVVKIIKNLGVKNIVIDIENDKHILGYYFFDNPFKTLVKNGCYNGEHKTLICSEDETGLSIVALTKILNIYKGWEARSVEKIKMLDYDDFCFVYDNNYPNKEILLYLKENCNAISLGEKYLLYRCKK